MATRFFHIHLHFSHFSKTILFSPALTGIPDAHDDEFITLMDKTFKKLEFDSDQALDFHQYCEWINLVMKGVEDPGFDDTVFPVLHKF